MANRVGVEDTRLESKTKNTKNIQGQGQPFRGQTLSKPRTGMLEAKDQGHRCINVLQKKKVFKNFFRRSQKQRCSKIFSGNLKKTGLQNFFQAISKNETKTRLFKIFFQAIYKILTIQKTVLSSSRGQGNFQGLGASRPRPRT